MEQIAMPLIRAVYPQQIAQELVSVQPMQPPEGTIWFAPAGTTRGRIESAPDIVVHEPPPPKKPIKHIRKLRIPDESGS